MYFLSILKEKYEEIKYLNSLTINKSIISKAVFEALLDISKEDVNEVDSKINFNSAGDVEITVISSQNKHVPIYISLIDPNIIDIQIGEGIEYLYMQEIKNEDELELLKETLSDLLKNDINVEKYNVRGKTKKLYYEIPYEENGVSKINRYACILGIIWFWDKVKIERNVFESWLKINGNVSQSVDRR